MAKQARKKKTFYGLVIRKGKQFIKVDLSHTPYICKVTMDLFKSKGYSCKFFIHQSVNNPLKSIVKKVKDDKIKFLDKINVS